jgi:hypothetical protein
MLSDKDKEMLNLLGIRAGIVAENPEVKAESRKIYEETGNMEKAMEFVYKVAIATLCGMPNNI